MCNLENSTRAESMGPAQRAADAERAHNHDALWSGHDTDTEVPTAVNKISIWPHTVCARWVGWAWRLGSVPGPAEMDVDVTSYLRVVVVRSRNSRQRTRGGGGRDCTRTPLFSSPLGVERGRLVERGVVQGDVGYILERGAHREVPQRTAPGSCFHSSPMRFERELQHSNSSCAVVTAVLDNKLLPSVVRRPLQQLGYSWIGIVECAGGGVRRSTRGGGVDSRRIGIRTEVLRARALKRLGARVGKGEFGYCCSRNRVGFLMTRRRRMEDPSAWVEAGSVGDEVKSQGAPFAVGSRAGRRREWLVEEETKKL
ncbi:hypothetical protein C8J57DRAFT_1470622 [Mycena rebaudengoi]|nr:hypothetical protein C8J57DRAFT_1470622 [Mycena rebaudengoi]